LEFTHEDDGGELRVPQVIRSEIDQIRLPTHRA
jgi:hypothetical protein